MNTKAIVRNILPVGVKRNLKHIMNIVSGWKTAFHLGRVRHRMCSSPRRSNKIERLLHYAIRINDGLTFYSLYKDIFVNKIYHFEAERRDPLILDCGSNIGGVILYFKYVYPQSRIIGFEADPIIFPYLEENIKNNNLENVRIIPAALANTEGTMTFYSDGKCGSCLAGNLPDDAVKGLTKHQVPTIRLREYLAEPVDFLKMNIEGAEWEVLSDSEDRLRHVKEMVIEYHHWPGLPRTLHNILEMLNRIGFEYIINDFDYEVNGKVYPPFSLTKDTRYYLLIYAKRMD